MVTLHIENTVHDYAAWKSVFDKFDRFRAERGVQSLRLFRKVEDPHQVAIDLEFETVEAAIAFRGALEQIWRTPQSREQLADHNVPVLYEVMDEKLVSAAAASTA